MKLSKKATTLGFLFILATLSSTTLYSSACQNGFYHHKNRVITIQYQEEFVDLVSLDEFWFDAYDVIHASVVTTSRIVTEGCPLQGILTETTHSHLKAPDFTLGVWYNSFEGTYNGKPAGFGGWASTRMEDGIAVGYGLFTGTGALSPYIINFKIEGTATDPLTTSTLELIPRGMEKSLDFEFIYDNIGTPEQMWVDDSGIWFLENTPHSGYITSASKHYFSGNVHLDSNLILYDDLNAPTTFNSNGWGPFTFIGHYKHRRASFSGNVYFLIDNFEITGLLLATGEGNLKNCLITALISGTVGGPMYAQMSIYKIH